MWSTPCIQFSPYATATCRESRRYVLGRLSVSLWKCMGKLPWYISSTLISRCATRSLLREARTEDDKKLLNDRMQTARSLCSIAACNTAFEDCQEGESYDLGMRLSSKRIFHSHRRVDAVWQLVGMSQWAIGFTENLLKQCLLVNPTSTPDSTNSQVDGEDLFGSTPSKPITFSCPTLTHLLR